jgi:hypothetical protein
VEVFVNEGELVQTARIFPRELWDGLAFFGPADVAIESFDFWKMASIWPENEQALALSPEQSETLLRIFPNPNTGLFKTRSKEEITQLAVFDLRGAQVPVQVKKEENSSSVYLSERNKPGLYFLKASFRNGRVVVKKIVVK